MAKITHQEFDKRVKAAMQPPVMPGQVPAAMQTLAMGPRKLMLNKGNNGKA